MLIASQGFTIRGYYVPPFEAEAGKLVRIYIPNFSVTNEKLGFDFSLELCELLYKNKVVVGLNITTSVLYAKNHQHNFWERNFSIKTTKQYLTKKLGVTSGQADDILAELGMSATERMDCLKWSKRKALTMKALLVYNSIISFDYYGISADSIDWVNDVIKHELDKGKCLIGFDNLQYMEEQEPYDSFERVVVTYIGET